MKITTIDKNESKLKNFNLNDIVFGKYFSDHMLECDYENGKWQSIEIKQYQPFLIYPSISALHYGQAIFEGVKAYKNQDGEAFIFRPEDNWKRFNLSAKRMQMPEVSHEIFVKGMKELVNIDRDWIPSKSGYSLYIRPFMFSTDEVIGVKASETYKFMIILSPAGPYYNKPMKIYVEEKYVRAVPGGTGNVKTAGNYGVSMFTTAEAKKNGYDQVLWTDAMEHKYVQEIGTMNVFFIAGKKALTPDLSNGTILEGVTRDSVITILHEIGYEVEERPISIDELVELYKEGKLTEAFGTGTAATISQIGELKYRDVKMAFDGNKSKVAEEVKQILTDIREGKIEDKYNWMQRVI